VSMNYEIFTAQKQNAWDSADNQYFFQFSPIVNNQGSVLFRDCSGKEEQTIELGVKDEEFKLRFLTEFPSIIADLVDLAVAIHVSDRLAPQNLKQKNFLHVVLPVRQPEIFNSESFQTKLEDLLEWTTGSQWVFHFQKRMDPERSVEHQSLFSAIPKGCEVGLWSGGLDALAGVYTRLKKYPEKSFVLFGTGSNKMIHGRQKKVAEKIKELFPRRTHLFRLLILVNLSNSNKVKNKLFRARGVVFTLLGSACAYLMGEQVLNVYENGIGAINLPYRPSAVGLDHSRSVHPLTLLMVSEMVSELLGKEFRVKNPFLFWTKAQMCEAMRLNKEKDLPLLTISCDRPHRRKAKAVQCGYCSSCLLRRQALAAAQIEDKTDYVILHEDCPPENRRDYFLNMREQIVTFRNLLQIWDTSSSPWEKLTREFPILDDIVDRSAKAEELSPGQMRKYLIELYKTYVREWETFEPQLSSYSNEQLTMNN